MKRYQDKTALVWNDEKRSYQQIYSRACAFAEALAAKGVRKGDRVAISLPRSIDMVCAVLGVLLTGGVYVPLNHAQPAERRQNIYKKADIRCCITAKGTAAAENNGAALILAEEISEIAEKFIPAEVSAENTAYIIFTSGSTGEPKGVEIAHGAAWNTIEDVMDRLGIDESDCCLNVSSLDFDLSVFDLFAMLSCGGRIILLSDDSYKDPAAWKKLIAAEDVTLWNSAPALFEMFMQSLEQTDDIHSLRNVLLSGDYVMPELFSMLKEHNAACRLIALGGATEAAIWSNCYVVNGGEDPNTNIPYGKPLANQQFRIIKDGKDAEQGQTGELWIGGKGLAKGYTGDPEKTAAAFVYDEDGKRWYRTGDMGYYRGDGNIIFLGRLDNQVKVNGFRIELGEIEHQLNGLDGIRRAVALADKRNGRKKICAAMEPVLLQSAEEAVSTGFEVKEGTAFDGVIFRFMKEVAETVFEENITDEMKPVMALWKKKLAGMPPFPETDPQAENFGSALAEKKALMADIFTGRRQPIELLSDEMLAPEKLMAMLDLDDDLENMAELIAASKKSDVIAFVSGREGILAAKLIEKLKEKTAIRRILYFENGMGILAAARKKLEDCGIETVYINTDGSFLSGDFAACADSVISLNGLHLFTNIGAGLDWLKLLMKRDSRLFMTEPAYLSAAGYISSAVVERGFSRYTDRRKGLCKPMLLPDEWKRELTAAGFSDIKVSLCKCTEMFMYSGSFSGKELKNSNELKASCADKLVYYMVPDSFVYCLSFPLTANGKIDRGALTAMFSHASPRRGTPPVGETAKALANIWKEILGIGEVYQEDNFFETGGDSLLSTRLISAIKARFSVECSMKEIFDTPVLSDMAEVVASKNRDDEFEEGEL